MILGNYRIDSKYSYPILERYIEYTNSSSQNPVLYSFGAVPCIIAALYNAKTTATSLTHLNIFTNVMKTMIDVCNELKNDGTYANLRVYLYGGNYTADSRRLALQVLDAIGTLEILIVHCC